jgi:hypothetical protein
LSVSFSCLVLFLHLFFAFQFLRKTQQAEADEEKEEKAHLARQAEKAAQFERYMAAENRAFASRKVDRVQTVAELKVIRNARMQRVSHAQKQTREEKRAEARDDVDALADSLNNAL